MISTKCTELKNSAKNVVTHKPCEVGCVGALVGFGATNLVNVCASGGSLQCAGLIVGSVISGTFCSAVLIASCVFRCKNYPSDPTPLVATNHTPLIHTPLIPTWFAPIAVNNNQVMG